MGKLQVVNSNKEMETLIKELSGNSRNDKYNL